MATSPRTRRVRRRERRLSSSRARSQRSVASPLREETSRYWSLIGSTEEGDREQPCGGPEVRRQGSVGQHQEGTHATSLPELVLQPAQG